MRVGGSPLDDPAERVPASRATWWMLFAVLGTMAVLWSLSTPMMGGPDEPAHAIKAAAVAHGQFNTDVVRKINPGLIRSIPITTVRVPRAYAALSSLTTCWLTTLDVPTSCAPAVSNNQTESRGRTYVGTYPPLYYVMVGWPARLLRPGGALYAMRICSALLCAALLTSGLLTAARLGRMLMLGAALGLTPMSLYLTGSINPSGLEIAAAFCVWIATLELLTSPAAGRPTARSLLRWVCAGVILAAMRSLSPAFLIVIVLVAYLVAGTPSVVRHLWSDVRLRVAVAAVSVLACADVVYVLVNHSLGALIEFGPANPSPIDVARASLHLTGRHIEQAIGVLGWPGPGQINLPRLLVAAWVIAIGLFVCLALVVSTMRHRAVLFLMVLGCIALPIAAQTESHSGADWQGRYGLPLLVGIPILAGWCIDRSDRVTQVVERSLGTVAIVAIAAAYVVAQQRLMTRNVAGLPNSLFAGLSGGHWSGPGSPLLLFAVALAASAGYAALLIWFLWNTPSPPKLHPRSGARSRQSTLLPISG